MLALSAKMVYLLNLKDCLIFLCTRIAEKNYTRTDTINKDNRVSTAESVANIESVTRLRSQYTGPFDYKTDCLFCGELIDERLSDSKQPHKYRRIVHEVATIPCSQTRAEHAQHRGDAMGDTVLMRVTNVVDLIIKYHLSCHLQFFLKTPTAGQRGRGKPEDVEKATAFKLVCQ